MQPPLTGHPQTRHRRIRIRTRTGATTAALVPSTPASSSVKPPEVRHCAQVA